MPSEIDHGHALVPSVREDCAEGGPQTGRDFQVQGQDPSIERGQRGNACDTSPREEKSNVTTVAMSSRKWNVNQLWGGSTQEQIGDTCFGSR